MHRQAPDMSIRPVTPADAPAVLALLHRAHAWNLAHGFNFTAGYIDAAELAPRLRPDRFFLAETDGAVVGTIEIRPDHEEGSALFGQATARDDSWSFHKLAVDPDRGHQGIGRALVAHAEREVARRGGRRLTLDTPDSHPELPAYYARLGFRSIGEIQWEGKAYRSVIMAKELPSGDTGFPAPRTA